MARTPSHTVPLGTPMPAFTLPDAAGLMHDHHACMGPAGTLVIFMCNHCPFVTHVGNAMAALAAKYTPQGIGFVGINSNDVEAYPQDDAQHMLQFSADYALAFPYLLDTSQDVARDFNAACTPDFFLYKEDGSLVYHGQFDDSRPDTGTRATGRDLQQAMDAMLHGKAISGAQMPSIGCNIKWKAAH